MFLEPGFGVFSYFFQLTWFFEKMRSTGNNDQLFFTVQFIEGGLVFLQDNCIFGADN
jgi:hypothetical protein